MNSSTVYQKLFVQLWKLSHAPNNVDAIIITSVNEFPLPSHLTSTVGQKLHFRRLRG